MPFVKPGCEKLAIEAIKAYTGVFVSRKASSDPESSEPSVVPAGIVRFESSSEVFKTEISKSESTEAESSQSELAEDQSSGAEASWSEDDTINPVGFTAFKSIASIVFAPESDEDSVPNVTTVVARPEIAELELVRSHQSDILQGEAVSLSAKFPESGAASATEMSYQDEALPRDMFLRRFRTDKTDPDSEMLGVFTVHSKHTPDIIEGFFKVGDDRGRNGQVMKAILSLLQMSEYSPAAHLVAININQTLIGKPKPKRKYKRRSAHFESESDDGIDVLCPNPEFEYSISRSELFNTDCLTIGSFEKYVPDDSLVYSAVTKAKIICFGMVVGLKDLKENGIRGVEGKKVLVDMAENMVINCAHLPAERALEQHLSSVGFHVLEKWQDEELSLADLQALYRHFKACLDADFRTQLRELLEFNKQEALKAYDYLIIPALLSEDAPVHSDVPSVSSQDSAKPTSSSDKPKNARRTKLYQGFEFCDDMAILAEIMVKRLQNVVGILEYLVAENKSVSMMTLVQHLEPVYSIFLLNGWAEANKNTGRVSKAQQRRVFSQHPIDIAGSMSIPHSPYYLDWKILEDNILEVHTASNNFVEQMPEGFFRLISSTEVTELLVDTMFIQLSDIKKLIGTLEPLQAVLQKLIALRDTHQLLEKHSPQDITFAFPQTYYQVHLTRVCIEQLEVMVQYLDSNILKLVATKNTLEELKLEEKPGVITILERSIANLNKQPFTSIKSLLDFLKQKLSLKLATPGIIRNSRTAPDYYDISLPVSFREEPLSASCSQPSTAPEPQLVSVPKPDPMIKKTKPPLMRPTGLRSPQPQRSQNSTVAPYEPMLSPTAFSLTTLSAFIIFTSQPPSPTCVAGAAAAAEADSEIKSTRLEL